MGRLRRGTGRKGRTLAPRSSASGRSGDRIVYFWLAALAASLASLLTFDPKLYINGDNAEYLRMGERVLGGDLWPSSKYPPLFPYLLAPTLALFGGTPVPGKILVFLCHAGAAACLVPVFRRRLPGPIGAVLLFAALTAVPVLEFSHYVMSEIPFLLALAGALAAADRWLSGSPEVGIGAALRRPVAWVLAAALAAGFYIRTAGAAVGAGVLLVFLLERRRSELAALLLLLLLCGLPWLGHTLTTPGGNPYVRQFLLVNPYYPEFGTLGLTDVLQRIRHNAIEYFRQILPLSLLPIPYRSTYSPSEIQRILLPWPLVGAITLLLGFGIARGLRRKDSVAWVVFVSLLLVLVWPPIWAGSRFLVPLVPLCFLLVAEGVRGIGEIKGAERSLRGPVRRGVAWALVVFLLVVSLVSIGKYRSEVARYPVEWRNYFDALSWIRDHTEEDAVIVDRKAIFVEWVARRRALGFPRETDPLKMLAYFRDVGADYVLYPSLPYDDIHRYLVPAVAALPQYLSIEQVFGGDPASEEPVTFVFRFHPEGGQNPLR